VQMQVCCLGARFCILGGVKLSRSNDPKKNTSPFRRGGL
jgi:hypothetical protein